MPKACVTKKMKGGMSAAKAVAACYPKATKAAKIAIKATFPVAGGLVKGAKHVAKKVKQSKTKKEIQKSKPKKLSIRREAPAMEKRKRRSKAKSMSVVTKQSTSVKKKSKRRKGGKLGRDY